MLILFLFIAALLYFGHRCTTAEDREELLQRAIVTAQQIVVILRKRHAELRPYRDQLAARTPLAIATPAIVVLFVTLFILSGGDRSPAALLTWGASLGPRTTNGEWWRILTSSFIHTGFLHLLVNVTALLTAGLLLERYVGPVAFLTVYVSGALVAGLVNTWQQPVDIMVGASGAIWAAYGLLAACGIWTTLQSRKRAADAAAEPEAQAAIAAVEEHQPLPIPLHVAQRLVLPTALFLLHNLGGAGLTLTARMFAFACGLTAGLVMTKHVLLEKPTFRQVGQVFAAAMVLAIALAVPIRRIADVKPVIAQVAALETRTVATYQNANEGLKKGRIPASAVAQLIEQKIIPDLQAADRQLKALERIPAEHQPLVDDAIRYVELRSQSWQLRADGLRKVGAVPVRDVKQTGLTADTLWRTRAEAQYRANLTTFGKAEGAERASLEALRRIRPASE